MSKASVGGDLTAITKPQARLTGSTATGPALATMPVLSRWRALAGTGRALIGPDRLTQP
jgi:hypothetical protein